MKKIIISIMAVAAFGIAASAQTMTDALTFGQNNYYGTARSMALGNAVTALGGDLGSIGINPAGSAVSRYSQFAVTPAQSVSYNVSSFSQSNYTMVSDAGKYECGADNFGPEGKTRYSRKTLPNIGLSLSYDTGFSSGVRNISFAFLSSNTALYLNRFDAAGLNENTSMLGYFAAAATYDRLPYDVFSQGYDPYDYYNRDIVAAYDAWMINPTGDGSFIGSTQTGLKGRDPASFRNAGLIEQKAVVETSGNKHDVIMNMAVNVDNNLFVGFNLGLPVIRYSTTEFFSEAAEDPEMFTWTFTDDDGTVSRNFLYSNYTYRYSAVAEGIYGKIGVIYLPTDNIRLGASLQTPTVFTIDESWTMAAETMFSGWKQPASASGIPEWTQRYNLVTPGIIDLGVAVTFLGRGLVSADYEFADYSVQEFSTYDEIPFGEEDPFYYVNRLNNLFCGASHALRLGAEFKILPSLSVRGGYNVTTSPLKYYKDDDGSLIDADWFDANSSFFDSGSNPLNDKRSFNLPVRSWSFGIGWSSSGSLFVDAAVKKTLSPESYYQPYPVYQSLDGGASYTASALVRNRRSLMDVALTFGWRF